MKQTLKILLLTLGVFLVMAAPAMAAEGTHFSGAIGAGVGVTSNKNQRPRLRSREAAQSGTTAI